MKWFSDLLSFLWPAAAVTRADKDIDPFQMPESHAAQLKEQEERVRNDLAKMTDLKDVHNAARIMAESETKRRTSIEAKAGAIIQSAGIVTALFSSVPALSGRVWIADGCALWILTILLALALIHLLMAIGMAVSARKLGQVYMFSADDIVETVEKQPATFLLEWTSQEIAIAKRNEGVIGKKANRLSAAETYYIRGLIFFAFTMIAALLVSSRAIPAKVTPISANAVAPVATVVTPAATK